MTPFSVAEARALQRTDELLEAIADWATSHAAERSRNRRWAMALLAAERARRDARRAEVAAAVNRSQQRIAA
jgi:hypothetical protein